MRYYRELCHTRSPWHRLFHLEQKWGTSLVLVAFAVQKPHPCPLGVTMFRSSYMCHYERKDSSGKSGKKVPQQQDPKVTYKLKWSLRPTGTQRNIG